MKNANKIKSVYIIIVFIVIMLISICIYINIKKKSNKEINSDELSSFASIKKMIVKLTMK